MAKVDQPAQGELQSAEFPNPTESIRAKGRSERTKKLDKNNRKFGRMKKTKKFCNNRRKRRWRPYCKLSFQEKQKLGERETRRALKTYNQRLAIGLPVAPYNTTQFLMDDRYEQEAKFQSASTGKLYFRQDLSDGLEYLYNLEDPEDYAKKDFENMYDESMCSMSNSDLATKCLDLEDKVEALEKTLRETRLQNQSKPLADLTLDIDCELEKIRVYLEEINKLKLENVKLKTKNDTLSLFYALSSE